MRRLQNSTITQLSELEAEKDSQKFKTLYLTPVLTNGLCEEHRPFNGRLKIFDFLKLSLVHLAGYVRL